MKIEFQDELLMDFGVIDPKGYINGLLGLDLLMKLGAVIDLKRLSLTLDASKRNYSRSRRQWRLLAMRVIIGDWICSGNSSTTSDNSAFP